MKKQSRLWIAALILTGALGTLLCAQAGGAETSLVSFSAGALVVVKPAQYDEGWSAFWILDERADSGWASPEGQVKPHVFVIALSEQTLLKRLEFDTGSIDGEGRGAKDVLVEMSDQSATTGFKTIATVSLQDRADKQSFPVTNEVPGHWLRLTVKNNHGADDYIELMDFRGYGRQLTKTPFPDISGTFESDYSNFHVSQQGTSVSGCYESNNGLLSGGIEGRIMKITWRENESSGPAIMVFTPDGAEFFGLWWKEGQTNQTGGIWNGKRKSKEVGGCPHWSVSGGVQKQMSDDLAKFGRTRVYGINFDTDSAVIREESKPTLDKIAALLKADAGLKLTIEGHTDSSGTAEHNKVLSQQRADAVKAYLVAAGIAADRLKTAGFGSSKPVAENNTAMGRAQNRRVELVKN